MRVLSSIFALVFSSLTAFSTFAAWQLDNDNSKLSFVSTKKGDIAEVHHFNRLVGIVEQGKISLSVDLTSVDTNIIIRDQRMKDYLFKTSKFSRAEFTTVLAENVLDEIAVGTSKQLSLQGDISLHTEKQAVTVDVLIAKLSNSKVVVSAFQPLVINAKAYGLADGVAKLQALAGLPSISKAVPLTFVLSFDKT